jgi:hypothetical protein
VVGEFALARTADQAIDTNQKSCQRLTRAGGSGDEDILAGADDRPAAKLGLGRASETALKPFANQGIKAGIKAGIKIGEHYFSLTFTRSEKAADPD